MKGLIYVLGILLLFAATFYTNKSFSQAENVTTIFDIGAPIDEVAFQLSEYHARLAQEELAKVPPNETGASIHLNLGGMTAAQISDMVEGATLTEENNQKLEEAGPGNCIINTDGNVDCLD
jgi:hypothetical protein